MKEEFDVVVIGGGPGGSSTAGFLAKKGYRVLLLEREIFPRFHIGESLLPAAWDIWDELGVTEEIEGMDFSVKQGVNFSMFGAPDDIQLLTNEFPDYFQRPYTYHVERARFDEVLIKHAARLGADVRMGWSAKDAIFEGDKAVGVLAGPNDGEATEIRARMVVDATGRSCLLSRKLGWRKPDPALNKLSYFTHFEGAFRRSAEGAAEGSVMTDIHTLEDGWLWYIPLANDVVSVGAVLDSAAVARNKVSGVQERFDQAMASSERMRDWIGSSQQMMPVQTISNISYLNDSFVGDGFLMVGDASMFIDPVFSAGVTLAMRGGKFAAEAIDHSFAVGDFSAEALKPYEHRIRRPMERVFRMIYNWYELLERKDRDNIFFRSRRIPILRERLIVLLSGGYDRVDMDALLSGAEV